MVDDNPGVRKLASGKAGRGWHGTAWEKWYPFRDWQATRVTVATDKLKNVSARRRGQAVTVVLCFLASAGMLLSQSLKYAKPPNPKNGEKIYKSGCITCHGDHGAGAPETSTEFKRPDSFPDFSRCDQTTPEPNSAWKNVIISGGPARGFSQIMPAFGELLTDEQINDLIAYLRTFCTNDHWARGELNLPRALVTEKAFPEDEVVVSTALNATGAPGFTTDMIVEKR